MNARKTIFIALFFFFSLIPVTYGQEVTPSVTPSPTPVAYALPYPGLLPGHPLYGLKSFRDVFMNFTISNPMEKAEYQLSQSDKGLQATLLLIEQEKDDKLIVTTLVAAENDFEKAIVRTHEAKQQGIETTDFMAKLTLANKKHQEVIAEIVTFTKGSVKEEAVNQLKRSQEFAKTVSQEGSQ